jgi:hypothetical protein
MSQMTAVSATVMPVEISSAASPSPADVNTFRIRNAVTFELSASPSGYPSQWLPRDAFLSLY